MGVALYIDLDDFSEVADTLGYEDKEKFFTFFWEMLMMHFEHVYDLRMVKAFSNSEHFRDIARSKGVPIVTSLVEGKGVSQQELTLNVIKDIQPEARYYKKIFILSRDQQFIPLFQYLSAFSDMDVKLLTFKEGFDEKSEAFYFLHEKVIYLDDILNLKAMM